MNGDSLGVITKSAYPPTGGGKVGKQNPQKPVLVGSVFAMAGDSSRISARIRRFALLAVARDVLPEYRVCWCCRRLVFKKRTVDVYVTQGQSKAHYKNLAVCSLLWICPICCAKISMKRGEELSQAITKSGLTGFLVTFTLQHSLQSKLEILVRDLKGGHSFCLSGPPAKRFRDRFQIVGSISNLEYTFGFENGHHPHNHTLYLSKLPRAEINRSEIRDEMLAFFARYDRYLERRGYLVNEHTVDLKTDAPSLEHYLTKWGLALEVSHGQLKRGHHVGHFTPFQILALIGDAKRDERLWLIAVFREYAEVFKGRRQLVYSPGLRKLLEMDVEKTDEELAAEAEEPSWLFAQLTWSQFQKLLCYERRGELGRVLEVAAAGDSEKFWGYLAELGIEASETQRLLSEYYTLDPRNLEYPDKAEP